MATNLTVRINHQDPTQSYAAQSGYYIDVDLVNDRVIWTNGSAVVYNDCGYSPTAQQLSEAAVIIQATAVKFPYCFLDDVSSVGKLKQVIGANSDNNTYVFCFSFDGATATEPTLEAWDTSAHATANKHVLGYGTPANSMVHALATYPGVSGYSGYSGWSGTALAGANKVLLNGGAGAIGSAADLYANIYIKVPASYSTPEASQPVFTVRYTYS